MNKKAIIEGLLFLSGSEGLSVEDIALILEIDELEVKALLEDLITTYESHERGIKLEMLGDNFKLTTKALHKEYYLKLVEVEKNATLSQASLEVLAIVAYNQPVTRVKVDEVRGVSSSHIVRKLVNMNLIADCGRSDAPGRPLLYKTTKDFLDHFGLSKIEDLPPLKEEVYIEPIETDLFKSNYNE